MTRLALVVIARDEATRIARCIDSARPFVDDMVVLDTGSRGTFCTTPDSFFQSFFEWPNPVENTKPPVGINGSQNMYVE